MDGGVVGGELSGRWVVSLVRAQQRPHLFPPLSVPLLYAGVGSVGIAEMRQSLWRLQRADVVTRVVRVLLSELSEIGETNFLWL